MNLAGGKRISDWESQLLLEELEARVIRTLSQGPLDPLLVAGACGRFVSSLGEGALIRAMSALGVKARAGRDYLSDIRRFFSRDALIARLDRELGPDRKDVRPLGVLLHIAAGNADGLPAFSAIEGLLAGNINILKLPSVDGGLSIEILKALIDVEPVLSDYLYVFDCSSRDADSITKLIRAADAVAVWGGDEAVRALRGLVPPGIRLIEWGHKISFAYLTKDGMAQEALASLAEQICRTDQLLCSSCQGILIDTDDPKLVHRFCERFLPILERASQLNPREPDLGLEAKLALSLESQSLGELFGGGRLYRGSGCSLLARPNGELEPSLQYRNCWVKPLPRQKLLGTLRPHRGHLQTVGLLCGETERFELTELFFCAGAVRVTTGGEMSTHSDAHDGEYPLRRYTKLVSEG